MGPAGLEPAIYLIREFFQSVLRIYALRGGFVWLAYASPERDDLAPLVDALGIHPLSIEDCFDEDHLPKIDIFPEYTGILFNDFLNGSDTVNIREINFFLGKDFLVSVFRDGNADLHQCRVILAELALDTVKPVGGPARVLHAEREILARICRRDSPLIQEADLAYFSNLYDHLAKFIELVESSRETVTNLVQIQLSLASNAMTESANRTNRSVNRLTLITTIFMPLSLIAGIGGMSEWTMVTGPENWKIAYPILISFMALMGSINYFILKWLDRRKIRKS